MAQASLYDRLGGAFAIAAVVDRFSDAIIHDRMAGDGSDNPALREWHTNELARLPGLKFMRTLWVCSVAGGPQGYAGTRPGRDALSLDRRNPTLPRRVSPCGVRRQPDQAVRRYSRGIRMKFLIPLTALLLPLAACTVDVHENEAAGTAEVDVRSPVGRVSVRNDADARDTGLSIYPGARLIRDDDSRESANVSVSGPGFGVSVVAATFESGEEIERVVEFYRTDMRRYGDPTVCHGEVDFRGRRPVCEEDSSARDVQLVVGTEDEHRLVHVEPRGSGSKLALVYVRAR